MVRTIGLLAAVVVLLAGQGCRRGGAVWVEPERFPEVSLAQAAQLIPETVGDREGWAADVLAALSRNGLAASPRAVCQTLAVIEQESGFHANPVVPGLAGLVRAQLDAYASKLGPLGPPLLSQLLSGTGPGRKKTFARRLDEVRTERDVDLLFRELLAYQHERHPVGFVAADLLSELFTSRSLEESNPITTVGSMQVSVRFSQDLAERTRRPPPTDEQVRDELYTRAGGVFYGAARLLGFEAGYDEPLYRFADYNAGPFASRNAALQAQVTRLTGAPLALDGDLLRYDQQGRPLRDDSQTLGALLAFAAREGGLSERRVREDVALEKSQELEATPTYLAVKRAYRRHTGETPPYARLPEVMLKSPKLKSGRSTAWFAQRVNERYRRCLVRWSAVE